MTIGKPIFGSTLCLLAFIGLFITSFTMPLSVRAETAQWNVVLSKDFGSAMRSVPENPRPGHGVHTTLKLSNPGITINYYAHAYLIDGSGHKTLQLVDGAMLSTGDRVLFEFSPGVNSDIAWYATGSALGTPYGYWSTGAADPGSPACVIAADVSPSGRGRGPRGGTTAVIPQYSSLTDRFATNVPIPDAHPGYPVGGHGDLYARYAVSPPSKTFAQSGAWSGCVSAGNSDMICTASGSGTASGVFTFGETTSAFYGNMAYVFTSGHFRGEDGGQHAGCLDYGQLGSPVTVPAQSIWFSFTIGNGPPPPSTPALSGGACVVGQTFALTMLSADPDGDQIRYAIDWDGDGSIDQFMPVSGFVPSGTAQTATRTYATPGAKTVRAAALDEGGHASAWTAYTFTCGSETNSCPEGYTLQNGACVLTTCPEGYTRQGTQCVLSCQSLCQGNDRVNSCTREVLQHCDWGCGNGRCNDAPRPSATLRAVPSLVQVGNPATVSWSSDNVQSCTVVGTNGDSWTGLSSPGETSLPIVNRTTFFLHCDAYEGAEPPFVEKRATVDIVPGFQEI